MNEETEIITTIIIAAYQHLAIEKCDFNADGKEFFFSVRYKKKTMCIMEATIYYCNI